MAVNTTNIIIMSLGVVLLIIVGFFLIRGRKKKKQVRQEIESDILGDLEWCERRVKETKGTLTPQQILWELAKHKSALSVDERGYINNGEERNDGGRERENESRTEPVQSIGVNQQPTELQPMVTDGDAETKGRDKSTRFRFKPI